MRILLIVNILLCVLVLLVVPALVILNGAFPTEVKNYMEENSLNRDQQAQFLEIIFKTTKFQREKWRHKIVLPQVACGIMLVTNLCLILPNKRNKKSDS